VPVAIDEQQLGQIAMSDFYPCDLLPRARRRKCYAKAATANPDRATPRREPFIYR
jgi:hypothetical protein